MPLSRRFFTRLASSFKERRPERESYSDEGEYSAAMTLWGHMVLGSIHEMQEEAPSFNRSRFLEAAGFPADLLADL